jgi:hypothetical protein
MESLHRLPDHAVTFRFFGGHFACVSAHELGGYRFFTRVDLLDFPQEFACFEDFKSAVLGAIDVLASEQSKAPLAAQIHQVAVDVAVNV